MKKYFKYLGNGKQAFVSSLDGESVSVLELTGDFFYQVVPVEETL